MEFSNLTIVTHNGVFHTDEVFATAFIEVIYNREANIIRTRNHELLNKYMSDTRVYVLDVGSSYESELRNFDHHQLKDSSISSFGLVFGYLLVNNSDMESIFKDETAVTWFRRKLVDPIDHYDTNTTGIIETIRNTDVVPLQNIVSIFNGNDVSDDGIQNYMFREAVNFAKITILRYINRANQRSFNISEYERLAIHMDGYVILPHYISFWLELAAKYRSKIGIFQDGDLYVIQTVNRKIKLADYPTNREFIHADKFIAKYHSKDDAIRCIELTLKQ